MGKEDQRLGKKKSEAKKISKSILRKFLIFIAFLMILGGTVLLVFSIIGIIENFDRITNFPVLIVQIIVYVVILILGYLLFRYTDKLKDPKSKNEWDIW